MDKQASVYYKSPAQEKLCFIYTFDPVFLRQLKRMPNTLSPHIILE